MIDNNKKMHKTFQPNSGFSPLGIGMIVLIHLVIGYILFASMQQYASKKEVKVVDALLIKDNIAPPPVETPPPPKETIKNVVEKPVITQATDVPPTPPTSVPEVVSVRSDAPSPVVATQEAPIEIHREVPPQSVPVAAVQNPSKAESTEIGVACPKQVKPVIPSKALEDGINGVVKVEIHIVAGKVSQARILSGPKVYHASVKAAIMQYECISTGASELVAIQDFNFSLE